MLEDENETFNQKMLHTPENPVLSSLNSSFSNKRKSNNEDRLEKAFKILETAQATNNNECRAYRLFVRNKLQNYNQQVRNIVQHEISNILFHAIIIIIHNQYIRIILIFLLHQLIITLHICQHHKLHSLQICNYLNQLHPLQTHIHLKSWISLI